MTAPKKKPAKKPTRQPAAKRVRLPGLQYSPAAARKARAATAGSDTRKPLPKMTAKNETAKKSATKKPASGKAPVKTTPTQKPAAKKGVTKKPAVQKAPAKKPAASKAPAKKPAVQKAPAKKPAVQKAPAKKPAVQRAPATPKTAPAPKVSKSPAKPGKPHLSKAELAELRAAMMEERAKFAVRTGSLKEQSLTRPDEENPEEAGTDAITIVTELGKANSGERRMNQIDEALRAIQRGDYGICQNCGAKIPIERLKAMPDAKYCVPCQEEMDRDGAGRSPWAQQAPGPAFE